MAFSFELPYEFNAADYFVDRNVREGRGDNTAVICEERSFSYRDIQQGVNRVGNALGSLGVRIEERVGLLLWDTEYFPQSFFGAIKIGAVPVCFNTQLRPKDYSYLIDNSRIRVLIIEASLLGVIEPIRHSFRFVEHVVVVRGEAPKGDLEFDALAAKQSDQLEAAPTCRDDACFWLYSSGSTGNPKGTVHLQHDMVFAAQAYGRHVLEVQENDRCFSAAKLFFAYGLGNGLYYPFSVGAAAIYHPERPTPDAVYGLMSRHKPTIFFGVPTIYGQMLDHPPGGGEGVRRCISAGEALPPDLYHRWLEKYGLEILDGIGSTEMVQCFISNRPGRVRVGSTGQLVPGYEARIVDENLNDVAEGDVGTLLVKGDSSSPYYWNQHEKTKATMLGEWLNTGDKFYRDSDGFFHYAGRTDDMLKVGGIWVSPIEVEAALTGHEAVLECAVIEARDKEDLVKPKAYIVLASGFRASAELEKEIKDYVKTTLAHYKYPRWIRFVHELPKTPTGKIKRFELRNISAAERDE